MKHIKNFVFLAFFMVACWPQAGHTSSPCADCQTQTSNAAQQAHTNANNFLTNFIDTIFTAEFQGLQNWMQTVLWNSTILLELQGMADQLAATALYQTFIIGKFFDADMQLDAQRSLQKERALTHKLYQPSTGLCRFGSVTKSLAASERKAELNMHVMRRRSQDRVLANVSSISALGTEREARARVQQFKELYCDATDNGGNLIGMCKHSGNQVGGDDANRLNKDIDFARTFDAPLTLEVDFSDIAETQDEIDLFALTDNLYNHNTYTRSATIAGLEQDVNPFDTALSPELKTAATQYQDLRALLAKRGVAENSFHALSAMKSEGSTGAKAYLDAIIKEIGFGNQIDLDQYIGAKPSYHAQMEILTKKIYQDPDFYTNLYDTPVNVERKEAAMQAVGLMQKFDLFKSYLRSEMILAVLLEMAVEHE